MALPVTIFVLVVLTTWSVAASPTQSATTPSPPTTAPPPPPPDADLLLWSAAQVLPPPPPVDRRLFIWVGSASLMAAMMLSVRGAIRKLQKGQAKSVEVAVPNTKEKKKLKAAALIPFSLCFDNMGWTEKLVIGLFVLPFALFVIVVGYEYLKSRF